MLLPGKVKNMTGLYQSQLLQVFLLSVPDLIQVSWDTLASLVARDSAPSESPAFESVITSCVLHETTK